jgi:hypothetical protein
MGVGLAVLTTSHAPGSTDEDGRRKAELFTMAVQLIGFALVAVALSVVGWYVENEHKLARSDLRIENWLIGSLAFLMVVMVIRNAWIGFSRSTSATPWDRGVLERANTFVTFVQALTLILVFGALLDFILMTVGISTIRFGSAVALVAAAFLVVFVVAAVMLRYLLGQDASPSLATMSRRQQRRLLQELGDAPGSWQSISVKAEPELEPDLVLSATVWSTDRGFYWRPDDAYALARYHSWAGSHARTPLAALHLQRVSVVAGKFKDSIRGMRITSTTRRLWRIDAWQTHRQEPPLVSDAASPERRAGLVHISYEQLQAAGLVVTVRPVSAAVPGVAPMANRLSPVAPSPALGTHETTSPGTAARPGRRSP